MSKLDQYIRLNLKMVTIYCIPMLSYVTMFVCATYQGYWCFDDGMGAILAPYFIGILLSVIPLFFALRKICYSGGSSGKAKLLRSLPMDEKTIAVGKIAVSGICCSLSFIPMVFIFLVNQGPYGMRDFTGFLVERGLLPSQVPVLVGLAMLEALIFMFLAAEVILFVVFIGDAKWNWSGGIISLLAFLATVVIGACVSIPWFKAVFIEDGVSGYIVLVAGLVMECILFVFFGWLYVKLLKKEDVR